MGVHVCGHYIIIPQTLHPPPKKKKKERKKIGTKKSTTVSTHEFSWKIILEIRVEAIILWSSIQVQCAMYYYSQRLKEKSGSAYRRQQVGFEGWGWPRWQVSTAETLPAGIGPERSKSSRQPSLSPSRLGRHLGYAWQSCRRHLTIIHTL